MGDITPEKWFSSIPGWVYISFVPIFGGIAQVWAGYRSQSNSLLGVGIACFVGSILFYSNGTLSFVIWIGQILATFVFKEEYLARTYPRDLALPSDTKLAQKVLTYREDVDINTCSKDVLVKTLGIPIVYANDIMALRESGHIFTHPEELTEIVGIPETTVHKIAGKLRFSYNLRQESFTSWRRANNLSVEELVSLGLEVGVAQKLVEERARSGSYKSIADITKRTGLPIERFRVLI